MKFETNNRGMLRMKEARVVKTGDTWTARIVYADTGVVFASMTGNKSEAAAWRWIERCYPEKKGLRHVR